MMGGATAQQLPTLRQALHQTLDEGARRCPLTDRVDGSRHPPARQKLLNEKMNLAICQCVPENIRTALKTYPEEELSRQVTLEKMKSYLPRLMEPCLGAMFRELFGGEQCLDMLPAHAGPLPDGFCACMKPEIDKFTDAEAAELGVMGHQYRDALEKARQAGKPPPPQTPLMSRVTARMKSCAAREE